MTRHDERKVFLYSNEEYMGSGGELIVRVASDVSSKINLLDSIYEQLGAPGYTGRNWDAFLDVMRDLSWLGQRPIIINHLDLPPIGSTDGENYIQILEEAIRAQAERKMTELIVVFPISCRQKIESLRKN